MTTSTDFVGWMADRIKDGAAYLSTADKTTALTQALQMYSRHRPLVSRTKAAGTGGYDYSVPTGWVDGLSQVVSLEYPWGSQIPEYVDANDFDIYHDGSNFKLRFLQDSPGTTEYYLLTWTLPHSVSTTSTVYSYDEQAVADLAASLCLRKLAARQAQSTDTTIDADAVNYGQQPQTYTQLADRLLRQYRDHMGLSGDGSQSDAAPATVYLDADTNYPWGEERIVHRRRWH